MYLWILSLVVNDSRRSQVRTRDKITMASRLQYLLSDGPRVCFSTPFAVGCENLHTDPDRDPEAEVKHKLRQQLLATRRVSTERQGAFPGVAVRATISGKVAESGGVNLRANDDLAVCLYAAAFWNSKLKAGELQAPVRARFV